MTSGVLRDLLRSATGKPPGEVLLCSLSPAKASEIATTIRKRLVRIDSALGPRDGRPDGVIDHSDRGCQYTSYALGKRSQEMGVMPSMGGVGDACDNAMAESLFATLERWCNPHPRHSSLGYLSPINYERKLLNTETAEI